MKIEFSPSVYEHAAYLIGKTPWEVSRSENLIYKAHAQACRTYEHTPIVVGIDIYNLEAEAYGGRVEKPAGTGIPAISSPLFSSLEQALGIEPFDPEKDGRIPLIIACAQRLAREFPAARVCIPVSGPFSIATSLRGGSALLTDIVMEPEKVKRFLARLIEGQLRFCRAVQAAELDIALFESAAAPPLLSPEQFAAVELPVMKDFMDRIKAEFGLELPFIIGGDTAPILEAIVSTGTRFVICPAETDRNEFMDRIQKYSDVTVRINLDSELVERGPVADILREVDEIVALKQQVENAVLLGTGAVPYSTPPEHILAIKHHVAVD